MQTVVEAQNLTRYFKQQLAIEDVALTVQKGEVLALLGTNGAGKSTTLRVVTGNLLPDYGEVSICGHNLFTQSSAAKSQLGYLPDTPPLYGDFNVNEYLRFCAELHGIPRTAIASRVEAVKTQCELSAVSKRIIKYLSKGYQQRIGLAQALIHKPQLIILDEPTNGLDPQQIREMRDQIKQLSQDAGVLLSTHQLSEVEQIGSRVQMLKEGRTVFQGDIKTLCRSTALHISFAQPPSLETLRAALPEVTIESTSAHEFSLEADELDALKDIIVTLSVEKQWGLREMVERKSSLEQLFMQHVLTEQKISA